MPSYRTFGILLRQAAAGARRRGRARRQDLQDDRLARLPIRGGAGAARSPAAPTTAATAAAGVLRQLHAITASGDRTQALRGLDVPALVIHGKNDVLVNPSGGRATARAIPGARLKMVDGMGHDLPRQLWPEFAEEIAANAARARSAVAQPA